MSTPSRKVLVVEADEDLQLLMAALLSDEGYQAQIVTSVPAALQALQAGKPALILLDMDRLESQSEEFVHKVKAEHGGKLPVVIVGPRYEAASLAQAVKADSSLGKPFDIDAFIDIVAELTQGST